MRCFPRTDSQLSEIKGYFLAEKAAEAVGKHLRPSGKSGWPQRVFGSGEGEDLVSPRDSLLMPGRQLELE